MKFVSLAVGAIVIFALGFLAGANFTVNGGDIQNIRILPVGCTYEGKTYKDGEGFKDKDGCNSCSCQKGQIACTEMACLPD